MAWLQTDPSGNYHISFRFGGRRFKRSLRTKSRREAEARRVRIEENIRLVESGRLELPADIDIPSFLLSDGKLTKRIVLPSVLTLDGLFERFFENLRDGALEATTVSCMQIHRRHLREAQIHQVHQASELIVGSTD